MFKKPLLLLVAICILAGCGGGGSQAASSTSTTARSDSSRAATLPLRTSDLPAGFAAVDVRATGAAVMVSQCVPALLVVNAAQIGETFVRDNDQVTSQSYVLSSTNAARDVVTTLTDSDAQTCLADLLQSQFDAARAARNLQDVPSTRSAGGLDPATAQYRVVAVRSDANATQTVATGDLLICQSERSVTAVWLTWFGGSPDAETENTMVTALRARATAAFSG